jgi:rod shape determining protein RodA
MRLIRTLYASVDMWLIGAVFLLTLLGLVTMYTFDGNNEYFNRQVWWIVIASVSLCFAIIPDYRFLRNGNTTFFIYLVTLIALILVLVIGETVKGAQSRFDLGFFSLQPSDPAKLVLIAVLAKYFSKRHELIGDFRHIIVSGVYAA